MANDGLPKGWEWANLADIADVVRHQVNPSTQPEKPFNYLSIENIESNTGRLVGFSPTLGREIHSSKLAFTTQDVLYSKLRPYLNKILLPTFDGVSATDLVPIRPKPGVSRAFLAYFLRTQGVVEYAKQRMRGIQLPRLTVEDLESITIPLPPSAEQERIVEKTSQLFQELDAARQALQSVPTIMKKFRRSLLVKAFTGGLTDNSRKEQEPLDASLEGYRNLASVRLPQDWRWLTLEETSSEIIDCLHSTPKFRNEGKYCIDTTCITEGRILFEKARRVSDQTFVERTRRLMPTFGDILYSREGTIGNAVLVPKDVDLCLGQRMMMFRPTRELNPVYFMWALNSDVIRTQLKEFIIGTTAQHINVGDVKKIKMPVAPLEEQELVVGLIDQSLSYADSVEKGANSARVQASVLEQSIFAEAFRGELVPQNPKDEPASLLLERLMTRGY